VYWLGLEEA